MHVLMFRYMNNGLHSMLQNIETQKSMLNRYAKEQPTKQKVLYDHFEKSCHYEWMFWEMSWTMQSWKQDVYISKPTNI